MATEQIVTGKKYRILADIQNRIWHTISFWSKAVDCFFNDGKNAETKLGAINGITSDINGTSDSVAASIKVVNNLNNSLGGFKFRISNGVKQISTNGGVSWENFSSALSTFGQGEMLYGNLVSSLIITAKKDYNNAFLVIYNAVGGTINSCTTNGNGQITHLPHGISNLPLNGFILNNIKQGETITVIPNTQERFNYAIWC